MLADEVLNQLKVAGLITAIEAEYLRGSLTRHEAAKANLSPDLCCFNSACSFLMFFVPRSVTEDTLRRSFAPAPTELPPPPPLAHNNR